MDAKSIDLQPQAAEMLQRIQQSQNGQSQMGGIVTAAMLAAAEGGCECETCQLMRRASKSVRQSARES